MSTSIYKTLADAYPTSEALFAHLRDTAKLQVRSDRSTGVDAARPLALIHYDKAESDMTSPLVAPFRSVVWNMLTNRPVCVSPARGLVLDASASEVPGGGPFVAEDFVDGVMINQFHDGESWRVATRTQVNAGAGFYGKTPFAELFADTFIATGLKLDELDKSLCYSWVLQHPKERVVVAAPYGVPRLFLVEAFRIAADSSVSVLSAAERRAAIPLAGAAGDKLVPVVHDLTTLAAVRERVIAWGRRFHAGWQGIVIKAADGTRYKLRSAEYNEARLLRGNQAKLAYLWLERWSEGKINQYLRQYPEEQHEAEAIINRFKAVTQEVHDVHQAIYKRREYPLGRASRKYRKLIWDMRQAGVKGFFPDIRKFMNEQDVARKLWLVNYEEHYGPAVVEPAGVAQTQEEAPVAEVASPRQASSAQALNAATE
jgi:hypothetical protein